MYATRTRKVLTIHGIDSDGPWHDDVKRVLEPHFRCEPIPHNRYRPLGAIKIGFDPWALGVGTLVSIFLHVWQGGSLFLYFGGTVLIAVLLSVRRRRKALEEVKNRFDALALSGPPPSVIAHSLGTYFIGKIVGTFPDVHIDHLILTGCVLKRRTPWSKYKKINERAVMKIRNEVQVKDLVARLALVFYGFFPGLGHAGVKGFKGSVHNVLPYSYCDQKKCDALVHNVRLEEIGHNGVLFGSGHTKRFWLPALWELDPKDYEDFIELCLLADTYESQMDENRLGIVEDELRTRRWKWAGNISLETFMKTQIEYVLRQQGTKPIRQRMRAMMTFALKEMWTVIVRAYYSQGEGLGVEHLQMMQCLYPRTAVLYAIKAAKP